MSNNDKTNFLDKNSFNASFGFRPVNRFDWSLMSSFTPVTFIQEQDVVDRSDFRFEDEDAKISRLSEQDTGFVSGAYDYPNGKIPEDNKDPVTSLQVALRQGLISRSQLEDIQRSLDEAAAKEASDIAKDRKKKSDDDRTEKLNALTDQAIASMSGLDGPSKE